MPMDRRQELDHEEDLTSLPPTFGEFNATPAVPGHLRVDPDDHIPLVLAQHERLSQARARWEEELASAGASTGFRADADPSSPWHKLPHEKRLLQRGQELLHEAEAAQSKRGCVHDCSEGRPRLVHHDRVPGWQVDRFSGTDADKGQETPGPAVRVCPDFQEWECLKRFAGKVGRLTRPHLPGTGMWWAEFPGVAGGGHGTFESEFAFMCGPVLHQLCYVEPEEEEEPEPTQVARESDLLSAMRDRQDQVLAKVEAALAKEKLEKEASVENDRRLRLVLQEVSYRQKSVDALVCAMQATQQELQLARSETEANQSWWQASHAPLRERAQAAESEAATRKEHANALQKALSNAQRELVLTQGALQAEQDRAAQLMSILGDTAEHSEAAAARRQGSAEFVQERARQILHKVWLQLTLGQRLNSWAAWAQKEVRTRRVCHSLMTRLLGAACHSSWTSWLEATNESKRLRRAQQQCGRRWLHVKQRQVVRAWKARADEARQQDLVNQAKKASQMIKERQEEMHRHLEQQLAHKDKVLGRVEARCAADIERVLDIDSQCKTQERYIASLKARVSALQEEVSMRDKTLGEAKVAGALAERQHKLCESELRQQLAETTAEVSRLAPLERELKRATHELHSAAAQIKTLRRDVNKVTQEHAQVSVQLQQTCEAKRLLGRKACLRGRELQLRAKQLEQGHLGHVCQQMLRDWHIHARKKRLRQKRALVLRRLWGKDGLRRTFRAWLDLILRRRQDMLKQHVAAITWRLLHSLKDRRRLVLIVERWSVLSAVTAARRRRATSAASSMAAKRRLRDCLRVMGGWGAHSWRRGRGRRLVARHAAACVRRLSLPLEQCLREWRCAAQPPLLAMARASLSTSRQQVHSLPCKRPRKQT